VVVMNESFSSTTLADAAVIGKAVLAEIVEKGALCVYVTFVDELAAAELGEAYWPSCGHTSRN
jgi:DNA mismatch repair protein MutS